MCNSKNHPLGCTCGFGGDGHRGRRTASYSSWISNVTYATPPPVRSRNDIFLERHPEFVKTRQVTARFVNPNATCPVCGKSVFYYQNEHGSRVFFDELGPPWPKHPCTDTRLYSAPLSKTQMGLTFNIRSSPAIADIIEWQKDCDLDFWAEFKKKYRSSPWPLATIAKRMKSSKHVFLILNLLQQGRARKVFISCKSLPKCCQNGFLVAVQRQKISFFDTATMTPKEVPVKRYRGAMAFLDGMIESGTTEL